MRTKAEAMDEQILRTFTADYSYKEDAETKNGTMHLKSSTITGAIQKVTNTLPDRFKIIQINIREVESSKGYEWESQTK